MQASLPYNEEFLDEFVKMVLEQSQRNEDALVLDLGIALQYEYAPPNVAYRVNYERLGRELRDALLKELYDIVCDFEGRCPKPWVNELVSGDMRNLILGILTAITSTYDVSLGIAVPAAALIMNRGVTSFCKLPVTTAPSQSVKAILDKKASQMKRSDRLDNKGSSIGMFSRSRNEEFKMRREFEVQKRQNDKPKRSRRSSRKK